MPNRKPTQPLRIPVPLPGGLPTSFVWADVPKVDHPGLAESFIPVWGPGKEAIADYYDGDYWGALGNTALAASDLLPAKALAGVAMKGGFKVASKSWKYQRQLLGKAGVAAKGQHMSLVDTSGRLGKVCTSTDQEPNLELDADEE